MSALLQIEGISKRFGGYNALADVSFALQEGTIHSLIGPNGAGKTTLLNVISGVLLPSEGKLVFKAKDYTGQRPDRIVGMGIARNFQHVRLFRGLSVLENVLVGRHVRIPGGFLAAAFQLPFSTSGTEMKAHAKGQELLEFVGIAHRAQASVGDLTLVEQRQVEIARALASEPKLLLLDEPAAGMIPAELDSLSQLLRKICAQGTSILLVEHHMRLVMSVSNTVTVLKTGAFLAQGTPDEVRNHPDVIGAYLGNEGWAF